MCPLCHLCQPSKEGTSSCAVQWNDVFGGGWGVIYVGPVQHLSVERCIKRVHGDRKRAAPAPVSGNGVPRGGGDHQMAALAPDSGGAQGRAPVWRWPNPLGAVPLSGCQAHKAHPPQTQVRPDGIVPLLLEYMRALVSSLPRHGTKPKPFEVLPGHRPRPRLRGPPPQDGRADAGVRGCTGASPATARQAPWSGPFQGHRPPFP